MKFNNEFKGSTVLITGGTKGIGKGIAEVFLSEGANVVVCGRNKPDSVANVLDNKAHFITCDVRKPHQIEEMSQQILKKYKSIDILINNAGGGPPTEAATTSTKLTELIVNLNYIAPFFVSQIVNNIMQDQLNGGSIVNISSVSVIRPSPGAAVYGGSKAGLSNLTESLAIEWAPKVRVNCILSGLIETEDSIMHYGSKKSINNIANNIPLKRMGLPKDIGNSCLFLSSSLAEYISGSSLLVHGGGERPAYLKDVK